MTNAEIIQKSYAAERSYSHNLDNIINVSGAVGAWGNKKESTTELVDISGNGNIGTINGAMPSAGFFMGRRYKQQNANSVVIPALGSEIDDEITVTIVAKIKNVSPERAAYFTFNNSGARIWNDTNRVLFFESKNIDSTYRYTFGPAIALNTLAVFSCTYSKSHASQSIYIDNTEYTTSTDGKSLTINAGGLIGGNIINSPNRYLDGNILMCMVSAQKFTLPLHNAIANTLARLPFWSVNFTDYPDNVTEYTDNLPYSSAVILSGTFKVDADVLDCVGAGTITYRAAHEFDGSEFIVVNKGLETEFSGTGSATSGNTTVSIAQGSNKVTVAMGTTDTIDSIDIQFRAEV